MNAGPLICYTPYQQKDTFLCLDQFNDFVVSFRHLSLSPRRCQPIIKHSYDHQLQRSAALHLQMAFQIESWTRASTSLQEANIFRAHRSPRRYPLSLSTWCWKFSLHNVFPCNTSHPQIFYLKFFSIALASRNRYSELATPKELIHERGPGHPTGRFRFSF